MDPSLAKIEYIKKKVDPILSKLMVDLLVTEPSNPVEFMIKWLTDRREFLANMSASPTKGTQAERSRVLE